ncbi:MAG: hypothetical protein ACRDOX_13450, partial [Nocardioides sp.]
LYVVSGDDGVLRVSDLGSGDCGDVAVEVADPGNDLGAPQESRGRVFVPDFTAGTVIVVDLESRRVTRTAELVTPGTAFELFDRDGIVFGPRSTPGWGTTPPASTSRSRSATPRPPRSRRPTPPATGRSSSSMPPRVTPSRASPGSTSTAR